MTTSIQSVITGTGSYIPPNNVPNSDFLDRSFLKPDGESYKKSNEEIIEKFAEITGIKSRRYAADDVMASDMGAKAGQKALEAAGTDPNELDYLIVAHNFGDLRADNPSVDMVPSLASRVKQKLSITNPSCIAYDLPFGCPGWLQGVIQSHYYLRSGDANKCLVIGTETLSRICDPHDRDSMIYADGAGATVLEAKQNNMPVGILSHDARTDAEKEAFFLQMEPSFNDKRDDTLYMKMDGRKLYQYALSKVPGVVKTSLEKADIPFEDVHKVLIHQANAKMDQAILDRLAKLYDQKVPDNIMPMTISWLGNTSVATVPTMLDLILRDKMEDHQIKKDDIIVLSSVGAGMNINSVVYKMA
ncbi:3-oxoacyl-[acyl-carrier-protein] synthase-3 [Fodinibius salinus]|uniref:3-oxoacyl-[acyl-carrier-protein] synthase-3 n=1 Tax=Fodinibius salinus TaxID=860790 RepID=A0A5D3YKW2_9BACT|nr:ketoacyl-ACP synthase III [Fodinibius salinus]TYP94785.1 3-oxoacyl-[acyl-carrier-protein] synthase-3 [Fodinibius salinus]